MTRFHWQGRIVLVATVCLTIIGAGVPTAFAQIPGAGTTYSW